MEEMRNTYKILVGKREGKRSLGRPSRRWKDNIRMCLKGVRCEDVDWIKLVDDRDLSRAAVNAVMDLRVPQKRGECLDQVSDC